MADVIVVNSKFTAEVFASAFTWIPTTPRVLYPGILLKAYDKKVDKSEPSVSSLGLSDDFVLSINRFERKKDIGLAIEAFALLREKSPSRFPSLKLVVAGGYDARVAENVAYLKELEALAQGLALPSHVWTLDQPMPTDAKVLFLPSFTETVRHGDTGFLCEPDPESFAHSIAELVGDEEKALAMGRAGRNHVAETFSLDRFGDSLEKIVYETKASNNVDAYVTWACVALLLGSILPLALLLATA
ncbi:hypothetical protein HDU91_003860 [Kappamyces sp. JEL0680]|nr:hypothetical protein HDU91_003860 [Kappamyces sp. JEL0680]